MIGAVGGVFGIIGLNDLAKAVIAPVGAVRGSTGAGGMSSLADGIHGVSDGGNIGSIAIASVGLCQERVAFRLKRVGNGVDRAGDALEQGLRMVHVAVGETARRVGHAGEAAGGGIVGVIGHALRGGASFQCPAHVAE